MRICNGGTDIPEQLQARPERDSLSVIEQRLAFDILHDEVGQPVVGRSAVQHPGDVRMIEAAENTTLAAESFDHLVRIHAAFDEFQRDRLLVYIIFSNGQVDRTHTTASEHLGDAVRTDAAAYNRGAYRRRQ